MPLTENTNPTSLGDSTGAIDPLAAGLPPLYDDGIADDRLLQPGTSDPAAGAAFVVIDDSGVISESDRSTETEDPILGESSETEIDSTLPEAISGTPQTGNPQTEPLDPLINPGNEAIEDGDPLPNSETEELPEIDDTASETQAEVIETNSEEEDTVEEEEDVGTTDNNAESEENEDETEEEEDTIEDDIEATNHETSNTSESEENEDETEEEAIADDGEVAVDPIAESEPLPVLEIANTTPGIYTVGSDGKVLIDYNYDHGSFESQVAIVSLAGLEDFFPTDDDFSQFNAEVSRRALSGSELGHIVIDDVTEGARFSNSKWGPDRNFGTYLGVKAFEMNPGDKFMVVMVPNRTFQETLDKSVTNRSQQLLFSVSQLNPGEHVQFVQVAAGSADGNLFAFEDLRLDRNSDQSFNDIVLQMRGIEGQAPLLSDLIDPNEGFWSKDMGQALIDYGDPYLTPEPIDLPIVPDIEDLPSVGVINNSVTRDDDTAEAGLETTVIRDDEVVVDENTDTAEEETVIDAPDTTSEESEDVEDTIPDDETPEASTGFAGVPTISTSPPEPYNFATKNQPTIVVIDTGFSGNNPDIQYDNITPGSDLVAGDSDPFLAPGESSEHGTHILGIIAATQNNGVGINGINDDAPIVAIRAIGSGRIAEAIIEGVDRIQASGQPNGIINLSLDLTQTNSDGSITTRYELTPEEREAIEYARQHGVILAVAAGNDGAVMSVLGQASQEFDNIITVGAAERVNGGKHSGEGVDKPPQAQSNLGIRDN